MPTFHYSNVNPSPLSLALLLNGQWWNWATSKWENPFNAANHLQACVPNHDISSIQTANLDASLIQQGCDVVEFVTTATGPTPTSTLPVPANWSVPAWGRGVVAVMV